MYNKITVQMFKDYFIRDFPYMVYAVQKINFPSLPTSGTFRIGYGAAETADINFDATANDIEIAMRLIVGLESITVIGSIATDLTITFNGVSGLVNILTINSNTLQDALLFAVVPIVTEEIPGEAISIAITKYILDEDIQRAIDEAFSRMNHGPYDDQEQFDISSYYLSAHYLVMNIRSSSSGISGSYEWLTSSKGVGSVNTSYAIPQYIMDNPLFASLSKTNYGARYLEMLWPLLPGQMFVSAGATSP